MKRRTKILVTFLLAAMLVLSVAVGVSATTGTKSISAIFRNIQIIANGKVVPTEAEPFIVGGRTYVPLRAISEALGAWVDWNPATNLVTIKGGTNSSEVADLKAQIAAKDAEIARLKGLDKDDDDDIRDLEKELKRDYDELGDVEIEDISLSGDEDDVDVEIEVDLGDFEDEWDDLTDREIENWLDDLCEDIQDFFSEDTDIDGEIIDIDSDDTLVDFSKNGDDDIEVDIDGRSSGADEDDVEDVEDDLKGARYRVEGIDFEVYDVDYDIDDDHIRVMLRAIDSGADELTDSELEDEGEDIADDIADIFRDDADADADTVRIIFLDGSTKLGDFEYNV